MERTLDLCRWVYNETLAYRKTLFETEGKSSSKYATNALLPTWKVDKPDLKEVFSQTLQNVQERVDLAFKAFFRRIKAGEKPGYPRFKGKGWYDSFTYPQMGFKLDNVDCTPDNGQIVKQWYLRQPPLRTEPEICN